MIRIPEVRVIDHQGNNLGVMSSKEALQIARDHDLDLVEVSPNAKPPVCRIIDFGKFLYERTKKEKEANAPAPRTEAPANDGYGAVTDDLPFEMGLDDL